MSVRSLQSKSALSNKDSPSQTAFPSPTRDRQIYVIGGTDHGSPVKIGISSDAASRLRQLQTGNPHRLSILHLSSVQGDIAEKVEAACHKLLMEMRMEGEWFGVDVEKVVETIDRVLIERLWEEAADVSATGTVALNIRIPADLRRQIDDIAAARRWSLVTTVNELLLESVASHGRQQAPDREASRRARPHRRTASASA